jgi:hypothetical protein
MHADRGEFAAHPVPRRDLGELHEMSQPIARSSDLDSYLRGSLVAALS